MNVNPVFSANSPDQNPPNPAQVPSAVVSTIQSIAQPVLEPSIPHVRRRSEQEIEEIQPERKIARSDQTPPETPSADIATIQTVAQPILEQSNPHIRRRNEQETEEIQPERKIPRSTSPKTCPELIYELKLSFKSPRSTDCQKQWGPLLAQLAEQPFHPADIAVLLHLFDFNKMYYIYPNLSATDKKFLLAIISKMLQFSEDTSMQEILRFATLLPLMRNLLEEKWPIRLENELEMNLVKAFDIFKNNVYPDDTTDPFHTRLIAFKNCRRLVYFLPNRDAMLPLMMALNLMDENEMQEWERKSYDSVKFKVQKCAVGDLLICISEFRSDFHEGSLLSDILDTKIEKLLPQQQFGCLEVLATLRMQLNANYINYINVDFLFAKQYQLFLERNPRLLPDALLLFQRYCRDVLKSGQSHPQSIFKCFGDLSSYFTVPPHQIQELFDLWLNSYVSRESTLVHYLNFFTGLCGLNPHYRLSSDIQQIIRGWIVSISKRLEHQPENPDASRFAAIYGLLILARFMPSEHFRRLATHLIQNNFLKLQHPIPEGNLLTSSQIFSYLLVALQPILKNIRTVHWDYPEGAFASYGDSPASNTLATVGIILNLLTDAAERDVLPPLSHEADAIYSSLIHCWSDANNEDENGRVCASLVEMLARLAACGRLPKLNDRDCEELKKLLRRAPCFALHIGNILKFTQHPSLREALSEIRQRVVQKIVDSSELLQDLEMPEQMLFNHWTATQSLANAGYLTNLSPKNSEDLRSQVYEALKKLLKEPHKLTSRLALAIDHCLNALLEHHCLDRFPDTMSEEKKKEKMLEILALHKQIRLKCAGALCSRAQTGRRI